MFISFSAPLIPSNLHTNYIYNPLTTNSQAMSYVAMTYIPCILYVKFNVHFSIIYTVPKDICSWGLFEKFITS
jgi:hypothetical protein